MRVPERVTKLPSDWRSWKPEAQLAFIEREAINPVLRMADPERLARSMSEALRIMGLADRVSVVTKVPFSPPELLAWCFMLELPVQTLERLISREPLVKEIVTGVDCPTWIEWNGAAGHFMVFARPVPPSRPDADRCVVPPRRLVATVGPRGAVRHWDMSDADRTWWHELTVQISRETSDGLPIIVGGVAVAGVVETQRAWSQTAEEAADVDGP